MNRTELAVLGAATLFVAIALLWLAWQASTMIGSYPACFYHGAPQPEPLQSASCNALNMLFAEQMKWDQWLNLGLAATAAPFVLGTLLGAPIVARELEHRTAGLAWSIARSRTAWFVQRLLPVASFLIVALILIGVAGSWFEDARFNTGFWRGYSPSPLLVARGLLTFAIGVLCGALVGRVLPAVLLTAVACAIFLPIGSLMDGWMRAEAVPIAQSDVAQTVGARTFATLFRDDATGELISMNDYYNAPQGVAVAHSDTPAGMTVVDLGIPATRYMEFVLRESALTGGLALVVGGLAFWLVRRRRPY
jgi:hypothetical protein